MRPMKMAIAALLLASGCATLQIDAEEDYSFAFAEDAGYPSQAEVSEDDDDSAYAENAGYPQ